MVIYLITIVILLILLRPLLKMFQPQSSVPSDPSQDWSWSQVQPSYDFFLRQYLPTEHKFAASFRLISPKGGFYLTQKVEKGSHTNSTKTLQDNVNVVVNLQGQSKLWSKFTNQKLKIHYDHGRLVTLNSFGNWHLYGSLSSTTKLKRCAFKLGGFTNFSHGIVDLRARYNVGEYQNEKYLYAKTLLNFNKLRFGFLGVFDVSRNLIQKNDVSLGLQLNDNHWIGAQLDSQALKNYQMDFRRVDNYFDSAKLSYTYSQAFASRKLKIGLGYQHSIQAKQLKKIEAAVQYETETALKGIKLKASSIKEFSFAAHIKSQSIPEFTFGFSWNNLNISPSAAYLSLPFN